MQKPIFTAVDHHGYQWPIYDVIIGGNELGARRGMYLTEKGYGNLDYENVALIIKFREKGTK